VNGIPIGGGAVPGQMTRELMAAWRKLLGFDFVAQALAHLREGVAVADA
jgi:hypothetical protein